MTFFENRNGCKYLVSDVYETLRDYRAVLLLENYGKKTEEEIKAGASPVQYIVAVFYNDWKKENSWDYGYYFQNSEDALDCFRDKIC